MTEHPILFSGPMVRAILDGRKTQTRRVVKPQPLHGIGRYTQDGTNGEVDWVLLDEDGDPTDSQLRPYVVPGDFLWVRETFAFLPASAYRHTRVGAAFNGRRYSPDDSKWAIYREAWSGPDQRWSPSVHMPRWASRITLKVKTVRVERLQSISNEDAAAEGCEDRCQFKQLWTTINAKRAPWDSNPWVWVYEFRRVT